MKNRNQLFKRMLSVSFLMLIGVLLLTACNGAFSIQGSANPNAEGGVDISAGSQQNSTGQSANGQGMDQTTLILIVVGAVVLILVLIMLASRRSGGDVIHHD